MLLNCVHTYGNTQGEQYKNHRTRTHAVLVAHASADCSQNDAPLLKGPHHISLVTPCIVHMLDWFEEDDRMNSQLSEDLFKFIFRETLSESQARGLMYQALLGAKHCLDRGVIHRDIKLDNDVINTATKQVKLINFVCGEIIKRGSYIFSLIAMIT